MTDEGSCDYCGLPLAGGVSHGSGEPRFCCLGCRFAASITASRGADGEARWMMTRLGVAIFFTMNVMVFTMLLWSQQEGPAADASAGSRVFYDLARHACLLFTGPVLVLLGGPLFEDTLSDLRRGRPGSSLLLLLGVVAAFGQSAWATWQGSGHVYFEVACMVLVAVTLGRWLEASGKLRTTAALRDLRKLLPDRVRLVGGCGETETALEEVRPGSVLRVLPGEHLPTDGRIVTGSAAIDERTVTGESVPIDRGPGDIVHSGTLDLDGELFVEVTAAPGTGTLERLIDAVARAASGGSRQQRLAERVAAWFLPLVLVVAAGSCAFHWRLHGMAAGVLAGLAVVVVSCPCALGLATPLALWAAIGSAARRRVLVRDGDAFARLGRARVWCFDKTGTLTTGCRVTALERSAAAHAAGLGDDDALLALAAALARGSTHVHAMAVAESAAARGLEPVAMLEVRSVAGRGIEGTVAADGATARLGSLGWIAGRGEGTPGRRTVPAGVPQSAVSIDDRVVGWLWFAETIRPEAAAAVATLVARGGRAVVLSGDRPERVAGVADELGIAWEAPLLPEEKLARIEQLHRTGEGVVMVGDGINDAPALAAADVGVALGCGADVSRWSADICLLRDDLSDLPWLADLAARTTRTIRWNLFWAFGYNAALVPLAAAGWIHPALAALAMLASSLLVVNSSLWLADGEPPPRGAIDATIQVATPTVSAATETLEAVR